jgi:hypothetical protein
MGAFIKHSSDFEDERAVVRVCQELAKQHQDPFARLLLEYSESSLKGKRLKFIRDARVADRQIVNDEDAANYAYSVWADKNGLENRCPNFAESKRCVRGISLSMGGERVRFAKV